jgi:hypothetical protein
MVALRVISGAARSVGFTAYVTLAFSDVDQDRMTPANTLSATLQQLAGGLGVAVGALGLQLGATLGSGGPAGPGGLAGPVGRAGRLLPLHLVALAVLTLTCLWEALRSGKDAGQQLHA